MLHVYALATVLPTVSDKLCKAPALAESLLTLMFQEAYIQTFLFTIVSDLVP